MDRKRFFGQEIRVEFSKTESGPRRRRDDGPYGGGGGGGYGGGGYGGYGVRWGVRLVATWLVSLEC